jgi:hypothetical protein
MARGMPSKGNDARPRINDDATHRRQVRSAAAMRANEMWSGLRRQPCRCEKAPVTIQYGKSLPTDNRFRVVPVYEITATSRQARRERIVGEQTNHTGGKCFRGIGNEEMLACCRRDSFTADAGRDRRHSPRQRVKNLDTHAASRAERNDHGSTAMEVRFDVGHVTGERDAVDRLRRAPSRHIRATDDREMHVGDVSSDSRKNFVDEIVNGVGIWRPMQSADKQQLTTCTRRADLSNSVHINGDRDNRHGILAGTQLTNRLGIDVADAVNQPASWVVFPLVASKHPPLELRQSTPYRQPLGCGVSADDFKFHVVCVVNNRKAEPPSVLEHAQVIAIDSVEFALQEHRLEVGEHRSIEVTPDQKWRTAHVADEPRLRFIKNRTALQMQRQCLAAGLEVAFVIPLRLVSNEGMAVHFVFPRQNAKGMKRFDAPARVERERHRFSEKQDAHDQRKRSMPPRNTSAVVAASGWLRKSRITRAGLPTASM